MTLPKPHEIDPAGHITVQPVSEASFTALAFVAENMREMDKKEVLATRYSDDLLEIAKDFIRIPSVSYLFYYKGTPVAVVGAMPMHPKVYSVAMVATDDFPKVAKSVTKFIYRVIIPTLVVEGCHRAQCLVLKEYVAVQEWLEFLGARIESTLERFGRNREDFVMMTWSPDYVCFRKRKPTA